MHERLYAIYDRKANILIGGIIRARNDEVARRPFAEAITDAQSPLTKHKEDYDLLYLGTIEVETGIITPDERQTVAKGADWLNPEAK